MKLFPSDELRSTALFQENALFLSLTGAWKQFSQPILLTAYKNVSVAERELLLAELAYRQQLDHPLLARVVDYGVAADGVPFCVFDHPEGIALAELPPRQVQEVAFFVPMVAAVLEGLAFLHAHTLLHGNLSSRTIRFVGQSMAVQCTNTASGMYGQRNVSVLAGDMPTGIVSPEVIRHATPDGRADLYSLGITLYEVLTGKTLFEGKPLDILRGHLYKDIPPIQQVLPRFPDALATFIHTLMEKDRALRFHTAEEALRFLAEHSLLPPMPDRIPAPQKPVAFRVARSVGRDALRSIVKSFLYDQEQAGVLELSGEHGLGKTTFLHAVESELRLIGHDVRYASLGGRLSLQAVECALGSEGGSGGTARDIAVTVAGLLDSEMRKEALVIFDNTEECDEPSKESLRRLVEVARERNLPLKVLLAHRSQLPQLGKRGDVHTLPHLKPTHLHAVCREILGNNELSDSFYKELYHQTNGHPLYIEEVLYYAISTGVLLRQQEIWRDVEPVGTLPELATLFAHRFDALPEMSMRVLALLVLAAMPLSLSLCSRVLGVANAELIPIIYTLLQAGYVVCQKGLLLLATQHYADAIVRRLSGEEIQGYKRALAQVLLEVQEESMQIYGAELLVEAGDVERALHHVTMLLDSAPSANAVRVARMLHTVAQQGDDKTAFLQSCAMLAQLYREQENTEREIFVLKEWSDVLRDSADAEQLADVLVMLAGAELAAGEAAQAHAHAEEAHRMYGALQHDNKVLNARIIMLHSLLHLKRWEEFLREVSESVPTLLRVGREGDAAALALDAGYVYSKYLQNNTDAVVWYSTAQELYGRTNDVRGMARALGNKGIVYLEYQAYHEALACFSEAASLFKGISDARGKLTALENIIQLYLLQQRYDQAEEIAEKALHVARTYGVDDEIGRLEKVLLHIQSKLETPVQENDTAEGVEGVLVPSGQHTDPLAGEYLVGKSARMRQVRELLHLAASNDSPVLLEASLGAGKEFVARKIHALSTRSAAPFCVLHTAGSTSEELDQKFFGLPVEREQEGRTGALAECNNGVIYLDDVVNLPVQFQAKLAYFLEHGEAPTGTAGAGNVWNVRIIAGCSVQAEQALAEQQLEYDLFFQLSINRIALPTLAGRREDIPALVDFLIGKYNKKLGKTIEHATPKLLQKLMQRQWTGGMRELENIIHRLMIREQSTALQFDAALLGAPIIAESKQSDVVRDAENTVDGIPTIDGIQKEHILRVLTQTKNNKSKAAQLLGIKRTTLLARMKKFGLMP